MSFRWKVPPSHIVKGLNNYERRIHVALLALCADNAQRMQDDAKQNAPWQDRTRAARGGLTGSSDREGRYYLIVLSHTVFYGKFLELRWGGRWSIILKVINRHIGPVRAQLAALLKG